MRIYAMHAYTLLVRESPLGGEGIRLVRESPLGGQGDVYNNGILLVGSKI